MVIDAVGGDQIANIGHLILDTSIEQAKKARPQGPPLSYIYCSGEAWRKLYGYRQVFGKLTPIIPYQTAGTWVHGDSKTDIISDRSPLTRPMPLTSWRIDIEQKAISSISPSFTGNVIRPSLLYGGSGSLIGDVLYSSAKSGEIVWYGEESARMATIHKEDLGEALRLCAEKVCLSVRAPSG